jgi:hypothetical protein
MNPIAYFYPQRNHAMKSFPYSLAACSLAALLTVSCRQNAGEKSPAATVEAATTTEAVKPPPVTTVQWVDSIRDMGVVKEGEKVEIPFRFKNTGTEQLVISRVDVACGCTVAEKPEQPVGPGKEGVIKASFDSRGRPGPNHKTVTVHANTQEQMHTLVFDVDVRGKE